MLILCQIRNKPYLTLDGDRDIEWSWVFSELLCYPQCHNTFKIGPDELLCDKCDLTVQTVDDIHRFYNVNQESIIYLEKESRDPAKWTPWRHKNYEFLLNNLKSIDKMAILLDIGAGSSPFFNILEPYTVYRVEYKPYKDIDFLTDLNRPLPLKDNSFDVLIMTNLLEHISEPLLLLNECKRFLKQDGKLIITVPFLIKIHEAPYDFLRYTDFMIEKLLRQSGFKEVKVEKIGNIFDVYQLVWSGIQNLIYSIASSNILIKVLSILLGLFHSYSIWVFYVNFLIKIVNKEYSFKEKDTIGYPQGYCCFAVKKDG